MLESGHPVLLSHGTAHTREDDSKDYNHVVTAVGYTIDRDLWHPQAVPAYNQVEDTSPIPLNSAAWVRHLIVHDENFGPYRTLGIRSFPTIMDKVKKRRRWKSETVITGETPKLAPIHQFSVFSHPVRRTPENVLLEARVLLGRIKAALTFTDDPGEDWTSEFFENPGEQILRPVLISKDRYIAHIRESRDIHRRHMTDWQIARLERALTLPWFWMVELSTTLIFTTAERKIGELLISDFTADKRFQERQAIPRPVAYRNELRGLRIPRYFFAEVDKAVIKFRSGIHAHVPMYRAPF